MKIQDDAYVAIDYILTLDDGKVVDSSETGEPLPFIMGAGMIVKGLEDALRGKEVGYSERITVESEDGYGEVQPDLLQEMPRDRFPDDMEMNTGMIFEAETPHGPVNFQVSEVKDDVIIADFNHPMAGRRLHFDIKVAEVREATDDDKNALGCGSDCSHGCSGCGGH